MGIWIRSQDKEKIINCYALEIDLGDGKSICSSGYVLGTYSTKEKALNVLDMIEKKIIENNTIICNEKEYAKYVGIRNCVFQMPDDEVKENE